METRLLPGSDPAALAEAAALLRGGELVAFPTETVYGLGADGLNPEAVAKIYAAKGRPSNNPLILHVADIAAARALVSEWPETAQRLAERFWPGPLTLVLPAAPCVPDIVRAGNPTVALRCPAHPVALALLKATGRPLAAPSANRTTEISPTTASHVKRGLEGRLVLVLDGGPTEAGLESTIVGLHVDPPSLLRPGPIPPSELEALLGPLTRFSGAVAEGALQAAPGMAERHYAPKARLTMHAATDLAAVLRHETGRVVVVALGPPPELPAGSDLRLLPARPDAVGAALYALLHDLDAEGVDRILFQAPPEEDAWLAVRDRLRRASAEA